MTKTFTQDDVIRYIYKETTEKESMEIAHAITTNDDLQACYNQFKSMQSGLDRAMKTPSDYITNTILDYSKSLNLRPIN